MVVTEGGGNNSHTSMCAKCFAVSGWNFEVGGGVGIVVFLKIVFCYSGLVVVPLGLLFPASPCSTLVYLALGGGSLRFNKQLLGW